MAKITQQQIENANKKLANNFKLDVFHYLVNGEKTAINRIQINDNEYATLRLEFYPEYEECNGYRMQTGRQFPCCHICKEIKDGEYFKSYGLGKWVKLGDAQDKKLFSLLQKLSNTVDIDTMIKIAEEEPNTMEESKPLFL